jgi:hypothetical protein
LLTKNLKISKLKQQKKPPVLKRERSALQNNTVLHCSFLVGHFCPPGPGFGSMRIRIHITAKKLCSSSGSGIRISNEDDILNIVEYGPSLIPASLDRQSFCLPYREMKYEEWAHFCSMSGDITIKDSLMSRNRRLAG